MTSDDCLFCRIAAGEIPATIVYSTERTVGFRDINPHAPVHVLVIPRAHHRDLAALVDADPGLAADVLASVKAVAEAEGLEPTGYRTIFNSGADSGQMVPHVHAHVLGGKPLGVGLAD